MPLIVPDNHYLSFLIKEGKQAKTWTKLQVCRGQLKCDGTHAETRFRLSRETDRVHLNRPVWRQFSGLLAAEVCASAVVMLDTPCSEVVWRVLATHCIRQFPPSLPPPVRHRVPSHFNWTLPSLCLPCKFPLPVTRYLCQTVVTRGTV